MRLLILVTLVPLLALTGCPEKTCFSPPPTVSESDRRFIPEISAKLANIPIDASLKANFEEKMKTTYQALNDKNVALYLCLSFVHCSLKGKVTPQVQLELVQMARAYVLGNAGVSGGVGPLSPLERRVIEGGSNAPEIIALFQQLGVETAL